MQYLNIKNIIVKISNINIFNKYNVYIYIYIYINVLMQYICFNFMIFNNTYIFNKYLL